MKLLRYSFYLAALLSLIIWSQPKLGQSHDFAPLISDRAPPILIAHAGGGLPQGTYSNSAQAFARSAANGFRLIEADFSWTQSGELVLIHDWDARWSLYFGGMVKLPAALARKVLKPARSADEFMEKSMTAGLSQMDMPALISFMQAHPHIRIITDVKQDNLAALAQIAKQANAESLPLERFIAQIYSPETYEPVRALGFDDIILTTYRLSPAAINLEQVIQQIELYALTVPQGWVTAELGAICTAAHLTLLTHTVNDPARAQSFMQIGVNGFYTDYLLPENSPALDGAVLGSAALASFR